MLAFALLGLWVLNANGWTVTPAMWITVAVFTVIQAIVNYNDYNGK